MSSSVRIGPYRLVDVRAIHDEMVMQLAGGACVCGNGDVLAYWNRYTDAIMGNEAHFMRSSDHGRTWEMTAKPIGSRHEEGAIHVATGMVCLADGRLLLPYADYQSGRTGDDEHPRRLKNRNRPTELFVAVSRDHGHSWPQRVKVDLGPFRFAYPFGRIVERRDGSLMLPAVACEKDWLETRGEATPFENGYFLSRDGGESWGDWHPIVPAPNELGCVETTIARCSDGSLLGLHRTTTAWVKSQRPFDAGVLAATRSADDGETWLDPEPTELHGECGCLVADGDRLIAAYRSAKNAPPATPLGMIVVYSDDGGRTWTPETALPDPRGRTHESWHETGMPDIVKMPSGQIGIVYYSHDPNLPWCPPKNDPLWQQVPHFWKRYLAIAILQAD
ncbi:MAG: exo-alpha-sialidase [Phycisphaerae bacterium]|nr:exo-alpha-sialidase [Phycisphaerae bacterium]